MYDLGYTGTVAVTQEENQHNLGQAIFRKMVSLQKFPSIVHGSGFSAQHAGRDVSPKLISVSQSQCQRVAVPKEPKTLD